MKKFLSLVLALVMTMSLVTVSAGAKDFDDNDSIDYDVAVAVMSECGVIDGYTDGSFKPTATLTRGAAAKIICNMILGPTTAGALVADAAPFKDVPANSTFAGYIAYCSKEGIISGYADGTFKPGNTLTGYAFMKMLLGALGYDKATEGYEGANWSINVAKRALSIGLDDGLSADFNGIKPVTREEACLYAFNTLQADLVKYDNQSTITVGDITISSNSKAEPDDVHATDKVSNIKAEAGGTADPHTVQFGERYFTKLVATAGQRDELGRPITVWKYNKGDAINEVKTADVVYSAKPKDKEVYTDLGLSDGTYFYYYINGVKQLGGAYTISKVDEDIDIDALGDGVNVEVFYDKDDNDQNTFSIYYTYAGKVTKVATNADDKREVTVNVYGFGTGYKFETEDFAKDDIVLVTIGDGSATNNGSDMKIIDLQPAEKLTGTVTKRVGSSTFYIDGTKYKANKIDTAVSSVTAGTEVEYYLDNNGYIVKLDAANSNNLENLAYVDSVGTSRGVNWAKLVLTDGTKKTVDLDDDETIGAGNTFESGAIVKFKTNKSGLVESQSLNNYVYGAATGGNGYYLTKGVTTITYGANPTTAASTTVKMNGKTTIVVIDGTDVDVYTGVSNIPALTATSVTVSWKNGDAVTAPAQLVVVRAVTGTVVNNSTNLKLFGIKKDESLVSVDGISDYYEILDIKTGETVSVKYGAANFSDAAAKVFVAANYSTNSDKQITSLTEAADGKFYYTTSGTVKVDGSTVDMTVAYSTGSAASVSRYINDDVVVYVLNKNLDEVVDTWTLADLEDFDETVNSSNDYKNIMFTVDDDDYVDTIVLVKSK